MRSPEQQKYAAAPETAVQEFIGLVSNIPVLQNVPKSLLRQLTPEMLCSYADGEIILQEGEPADRLIVILKGSVEIIRGGVFLVSRTVNEIIGEQGVVDEVVYSATAVAWGPVQVLAIPAPLAKKFLKNYRFTLNLIKVLSAKLREATGDEAVRLAQEEKMFAAFRSHVHPRVLDELLAQGIENYGAPRYLDCAILFADIRSYTSLSLEATPEQIVNELSRYLDGMIEIIHAHDGMIDKFIGDNVMAVWGFTQTDSGKHRKAAFADTVPASFTTVLNESLPSSTPTNFQKNLVVKALDCAIAMWKAAQNYSFRGRPIQIGIGLNYGTVFCGNVGNDRKRQFTVLGHPVNLASRFESLAKDLNVPIIVGENFYYQLPPDRRAQFREYRNVKVRGIDAITCYGCII
ncbi:MAG: cyclic nucleotide-binding domain-containing protein [candidate division KSB1 bacterium]|nr:cyclic nucleotide-binding domain-containing protein [candidate division KSB1 bacterium]MDZ7302094.1 cyclic nucleotide-binding domain-containing protein [candidate division KSB1 bacterium]MDZ7311135.1 cyclic nucleotide-binding domain-containing protein [candidate division KSB1 bacterium]